MGSIVSRPDPNYRTIPPPPTWTVANGMGIALTGMTLVSYIPQYHRLLALRSTAGISVTSVLLNTLVAQNQVANMYYLHRLRPQMIHGLPIATPPSVRDWINLTQIMVQWLCSLPLLALVITTPDNSTGSHGRALLSKKGAAILWAAQTLFYGGCSILSGNTVDIMLVIFSNIHLSIINPVFTLLAGASFFFQASVTKTAGSLGALSKLTLGLQAGTFLLSAVAWPFRLMVAENVYLRASKPGLVTRWYPFVGWACVNSAVVGVGQGVMLYLAGKVGGKIWLGD